MIYEHKTGAYIEVKPLGEAEAFAKKTKRWGAGVTRSLVESKLTPETRESSKDKTGTEPGAIYVSNLGEKRSVKR